MAPKNTICRWYDGSALEAAQFHARTFDQAETDRLWNTIVDHGGQESACGWCKDRWGLSWQITPRALTAAIADPDRAAAKRLRVEDSFVLEAAGVQLLVLQSRQRSHVDRRPS